ncbi:SIR2 family NAD-dependent protein deacylase [Vibrio owensii]|uniref:SIR2 family NAD-dependent protein deacylase n=1 Tax=Vibrio owensii TaxID=696485 RepID=UPI0018F26E9D|nr:Sir2 family NAD-dependent protein deacetylase [Vibrio owensii]
MSADHGTPVFRGSGGQYDVGIERYGGGIYDTMEELATLKAMFATPDLFWRFYRERKERQEELQFCLHQGYYDLLSLTKRWVKADKRVDIITTNSDGAFYAAGFDCPVLEMHGSLNYHQCTKSSCSQEPWSVMSENFTPDAECPKCGSRARPNIFLFDDLYYTPNATNKSNLYMSRYHYDSGSVGILIGAGTTIPTLINKANKIISAGGRVMVINPDCDGLVDHERLGWLRGGAEEQLHSIFLKVMSREGFC